VWFCGGLGAIKGVEFTDCKTKRAGISSNYNWPSCFFKKIKIQVGRYSSIHALKYVDSHLILTPVSHLKLTPLLS